MRSILNLSNSFEKVCFERRGSSKGRESHQSISCIEKSFLKLNITIHLIPLNLEIYITMHKIHSSSIFRSVFLLSKLKPVAYWIQVLQCEPTIGRVLSVANNFGWCQQRYVKTTGKRMYGEAQSQLYRWKTAKVRLILLKRWSLNIITLSMLKWKNPAVRKTLESFERNFLALRS